MGEEWGQVVRQSCQCRIVCLWEMGSHQRCLIGATLLYVGYANIVSMSDSVAVALLSVM